MEKAPQAKAPQTKANENDPARFRRNGPPRKKPPEKVPERVVNLFQASGAKKEDTQANGAKKEEQKASGPAKTSVPARPNARRRLNQPEKPATDTQASDKKTNLADATQDDTKASNKPQNKTVNDRLKGLVKLFEERRRATAKKDQDSMQAGESKPDKNSDSNGVCFYVCSLRERYNQQ
jgi:hypothetical protein